jgi:hypothetical protein
VALANVGTQARLKEAKQIQQNLSNGVYEPWDKTKTNRFRMMILSQMILLLSIFLWFGSGLLDSSKMFSPFRLVILALIFVIMFILGFAINRMTINDK